MADRTRAMPCRAPCAALAVLAAGCACAAPAGRVLDDFREPARWRALASDQVAASLRPLEEGGRRALCLAYDFGGVSGHAAMRRELPLEFPPDYEFAFDVRGSGPANQFEFKLIDAGGENVWWVSRPATRFAAAWTPVRYKKRQIVPAWGPLADKTLRRTRFLEFTIYANEGGRGEVCVADLRLREREPPPAVWPRPLLSASAGRVPAALFDAPGAADAAAWSVRADRAPWLRADFGRAREFGGLVLHWRPGRHASRYAIELSDDARRWRGARRVEAGDGGTDYVRLPEAEARYLRLRLLGGPASSYALAGVEVKDLAFGATQNAFVEAVARQAPRGRFPRAFTGQQSYWTVVGVDGGRDSALLGEDGAVEVGRGEFSIEPFVLEDGVLEGDACAAGGAPALRSWADVAVSQHLEDGYLPLPGVVWAHGGAPCADAAWRLRIEAFAEGGAGSARAFATYTLENRGGRPRTLTLALAIQPFQVNPPKQFLTTPGGVREIRELAFDGAAVRVDGAPRVVPLTAPSAFFATPFDAGMAAERLAAGDLPPARAVRDEAGLASGALLYRVELAPHERRTIALAIPLAGALAIPRIAPAALPAWVAARRAEVADAWRGKLDRVRLQVPPAAQPLADTLRTALAHMLIERDGVRIRPGTRSYARSWIRDGAMMGEGLLRLGHADAARAFLAWYAPYQFDDGKVPCCVDARGADPVPENDSHGELVFLAAEVARYTRDRGLAAAMWPHVDRAARYLDALRASERTDANRGTERYGLLPPSISHEGYSARPAYSYWDDFWGLTGYESALELARMLGRDGDARRLAAARDAFRGDVLASIAASTRRFGIDFIPGAADLGDFDATSTTIALSPGREQAHLPPGLLANTFERYWREFVQRRDGLREWKDYTPYEWRNVSAFVRLGWRARAHAAIAFFFGDRRPAAWNQWAEVVGRDPREPRFLGDLPHGWVASDFVRAALDLVAYERASDHALVLAAGVPPDWLDGGGVAVEGLRTPYGPLSYSLRREGDRLRLSVRADGLEVPPGGLVLAVPEADPARPAHDRGRRVAWRDGELRFDRLPVDATIPLRATTGAAKSDKD